MSKQAASVTDPACCEPSPETRDPAVATELAAAFKALGDPIRLRLLWLIAAGEGGEVCVCDLTAPFDVSGPTISHHLKVLRQAGLIDCQRRGTWVYYWVLPDRLARLTDALGTAAVPPTR